LQFRIRDPRNPAQRTLRMQFLLTLLIGAVAAVHTFSFGLQVKRSESVLVRAVIDGDTIDVAAFGRVRLLGIDAPEVGRGFDTTAPFGREARDRLASLVLHRWIRLEQEGALLDAYNRHLAYVMREDGVFVNAALVRDGLARVSARVPLSRLAELERAQAEAQTFRRGMWGEAPRIPSTSYTRRGSRKSAAVKAKAPRHERRKSRKPKS
jgi:endonuclease YncB( thermonuclease family)